MSALAATDYEQPPMIEWNLCDVFGGCDDWAVFGTDRCPKHQDDPAFDVEQWNERH